MHSISTTRELETAINSIEALLNSKDGDFVLDAIKKYKENKTIDQNTLIKLQSGLST